MEGLGQEMEGFGQEMGKRAFLHVVLRMVVTLYWDQVMVMRAASLEPWGPYLMYGIQRDLPVLSR